MKLDSKVKGVTITQRQEGGSVTQYQAMHCSDCARKTEFSTKAHGFLPEQALFKFARERGWDPKGNGKHKCDQCVGDGAKGPESPRKPARDDNRKIFRAIDEVYDENHCRYVDGWTDQVLAKDLGVPRKWVADVREEHFGASGENLEMERLMSNLARLSSDVQTAIDKCMAAAADAEAVVLQIEKSKKDLSSIREAVGPYRVA